MIIDWTIAPITASISILVAIYLYFYINKQSSGTEKMKEIAGAIQEGARAFLKVEFKYLAVFVVVVAVILGIFLDPIMSIAYIFGSVCSALAGFLGMTVALKANVKSANAAKEGLNRAFPIAFRGGAVMGLAVVGLALLGLSVVYALTGDP
jgi:K(+)-stimulated pyrophosphate-energized sodium pump